MEKKWDAFISHASEDKDTIVRELYNALKILDIKIWYDEFTLKVGDSLSKSIDEGLINSKYGIIVISKDFLKKKWTDYEYRSLLSKEENGKKIILPIWHNISQSEIKEFSLFLSNKVALQTSKSSIKELSLKLVEIIRPDIYENLRRYLLFREILKKGENKIVKIKDIQSRDEPLSKLTKQQEIRAKNIYLGIGQCCGITLEKHIYNFELDIQPEREIQVYEIMNVCYLEFIEAYKINSYEIKHDIFVLLLGFSLGQLFDVKNLSNQQKLELHELWKLNHYVY